MWMFTFILMMLIACTEDHGVDPYSPRYFIAESEIIVESKAATTPPTSATKTIGVAYMTVCRCADED